MNPREQRLPRIQLSILLNHANIPVPIRHYLQYDEEPSVVIGPGHWTSAPYAKRSQKISFMILWPHSLAAAHIRGVLPYVSLALISAPNERRVFTNWRSRSICLET